MTTTQETAIQRDVRLLLEIAAAIAGSGAVVSALMFYFGWVRTRVLFDEFGVPVTLLEYSSTEYVLRSTDVVFKPAIWAIITIATLTALSVALNRVENSSALSSQFLLGVRVVLAAATVGCAVRGLMGLVGQADPTDGSVLLCLSGTLVVLQYLHCRAHTRFKPPTAMLAIGVMLTLAAAFWAVSIYASDLGERMADDIKAGLSQRPNAVIYSSTDLGIAGQQPGDCRSPHDDQECRFAYSGYQLLTYSNHRWILIRQPWTQGSPTVILPDSDSVRVELVSA